VARLAFFASPCTTAILTPEGILTARIPEIAESEQLADVVEGTTAEDDLIDLKVPTAQCKLAVDALLEYALAHQATEEQNELLPDRTEHVWLHQELCQTTLYQCF
jgi:hypothetical protein